MCIKLIYSTERHFLDIKHKTRLKEHGVWAEAGNRSGLFIGDITGHATHYGVPYVMVHSTTSPF